jgi:hypothetical protein
MKMVFSPEQKIFMIEYYFRNGHTVHILRESGSAQRKPGSGRPKVRTEENIETVQLNVKWKMNPNYLSGNCRSTLSYQCQKIVRKDLEDPVTAERYRNNNLDVFINQNIKDVVPVLFFICGNFLPIR